MKKSITDRIKSLTAHVPNAKIAASAVAIFATAGTALAGGPPVIPALEPFVDLDSVGEAIGGGLSSLFTIMIPLALSAAVVFALMSFGWRLLKR